MATPNVIPPLPKGYTLDQPSAIPPLPAGYKLDSPQAQSADVPWYKRSTKVALAPIIDTIGGGADATARALVAQATGDPNLYDNIRASQSQGPTKADSEHPVRYAIKQGIGGAAADTADTAASFTSPVSLALMGAGAASKLPGAAATLGKVALRTAAPVFAGTGAKQVYDAGTENTPQAWQQRLTGGAMAAGGGAGIAEMSPEVAMKLSPRGALAARMAEKPAGEQFTRQEVLDAARANGVNLDLAQATDNPIAEAAKKSASVSSLGSAVIKKNVTANVDALSKWADAETAKYSPQSTPREELGPQIQGKLQQDLATKKIAAQGSYHDLDTRIGSAPIDATATVEAEARKIIAENKDYYSKHPELKPKQAWGILEDLAKRPVEKTMSKSPDVVLNSGDSLTNVSSKEAASKQMSWSELHQLRSDLMDFYRNNPDVVKGRGEAWIQRMVGKVDEAMTTGEKGLSGDDLEQFRHANGLWENIKSTYDNPSSPLYHAVRSQFPSQVPNMLAKQTPELANQVRKTLGSLEGPFQRQVVESLINDKAGTLDLKNLNSRLSRVPDDFLQSMLGEEGAKNLRLLGKVSQKVTYDANPSGTAKVMAPFTEGALLFSHPIAGSAVIGGNYGAAKGLTSSGVVDFLSKKPTESLRTSKAKR